MPKVTGPLFSIGASGTIAGTINYRQTRRGSIVRKNSKPSGDPSLLQIAQRALIQFLSTSWKLLPEDFKQTWNIAAVPYNFSGFNFYVKLNSENAFKGLQLHATYPMNFTDELGAASGGSYTANNNIVSGLLNVFEGWNSFGVAFFESGEEYAPVSWKDLRKIYFSYYPYEEEDPLLDINFNVKLFTPGYRFLVNRIVGLHGACGSDSYDGPYLIT